MAAMKFAFYCICGAAMTGAVEPSENAAELRRLFRSIHSGDGHALTDAATARKARRRKP